VYIDPVYYEKPPEIDELRDLKIRATAEYEGYTIEIFEDEMQLICRVPAKRAILKSNVQSAGAVTSLKNTPKSALSTNSSAPSSNPSSRPSTKRMKKMARRSLPVETFQSLYPELDTRSDEIAARPSSAEVVHSRPGSAVRFFQSDSSASDSLISTLVTGASIADPKSITNFASKIRKPAAKVGVQELDEEVGAIEDDDSEDGDEVDDGVDDENIGDSDLIEQDYQLKRKGDIDNQEYLDTSKAVKMSLRDGFTHYGLHLQWDLKEIPSFETHRNGDIFEESETSSMAGSEYSVNSSLPSSYARLLFV
jgi:hypothetical protein